MAREVACGQLGPLGGSDLVAALHLLYPTGRVSSSHMHPRGSGANQLTNAALNIGSRGASRKRVRPQTPYPLCDSRGRRRSRTRPPSAIKAVADHPVVVAEEDLDWTRNFVLDAVSQRVQAIL